MYQWLLTLLLLCGPATLLTAADTPSTRPPNLILIMADDLGFETIGANGGTSYKTPVLDQLAATGARFNHCYVQPLCTPTRVQLMTGQYNVRNYIRFGLLSPQAVTFGNLLKDAGYATCITGKWQLGRDAGLPQKFGFDESCLWQQTRRPGRYVNPGLEYNGVEKDFKNGEYGPDLVNEYALDFISRKKDSPFFLYYPLMLTHGPYLATPDSQTWDPKLTGEKEGQSDKHFGEMVEYMDKLIGKLVARLDSLGLREETLIVFVGDNGTGKGTRSQMGDRVVIGGKGTTTAAGMHVPLIVNWPGQISAAVSNDLVDSTDFLPTLLDAAAVKSPAHVKLDGRSILPRLRGQAGVPREWIYCWYSPRQGNVADENVGAENTAEANPAAANQPKANKKQERQRVSEFAFNAKYKLYRNGKFYDLTHDLAEQNPLQVNSLTGEALATAKTLQGALDQFKGARPATLEP